MSCLANRVSGPSCWLLLLALAGCAAAPPAPIDDLGLPALRAVSKEHWQATRRAEILELFAQHVYGHTPTDLGPARFEVTGVEPRAFDGLATRLLVRITLPRVPSWRGMDVMLYVPNGASRPVPCFVGLSFRGNHAVTTETDVPVGNDEARGSEASRWPLASILRAGFGVATAWYGDIEPDRPDGWREGLRGAAAEHGKDTVWQEGEWGAIGAWAFGLRLIADLLQQQPLVDGRRLAVIGHSRLGKTALWAGAQDERFAIVVSNDSGEGGAALMRRPVGESTAAITKNFPHWFTKTYAGYAADPASCPVDQHMLIALMAPRPVYVASAQQDTWADPEGEFLACYYASPVWQLFGTVGVGVDRWPAVDTPVGDRVGYHVRQGKHDVTDYDWQQYLRFAARQWGR